MEEFKDDETVKKIMHVMRQAPHGTIYTYEGLEMILVMAAYDQEISVAFIDDGVYALKKRTRHRRYRNQRLLQNLWRIGRL